jgi:hypothetical protein
MKLTPGERGFKASEFRLALPDFAAFGGGTHHGVACLAGEGRGELRHVGERRRHAKPRKRVRVHDGHAALVLQPRRRAPNARKRQIETLLGREAVDLRGSGFAREGRFECRRRELTCGSEQLIRGIRSPRRPA